MALPGFSKSILVKTTASSAYVALPATSANLSLGATMLEDTTFLSTGWKSRLAGLRDFSCSGDLIYDTTNTGFGILRSAVLNGTRLNFKYLPDGTYGITGTVLAEKFDMSGDVGSVEKVSYALQSEGTIPLSTC